MVVCSMLLFWGPMIAAAEQMSVRAHTGKIHDMKRDVPTQIYTTKDGVHPYVGLLILCLSKPPYFLALICLFLLPQFFFCFGFWFLIQLGDLEVKVRNRLRDSWVILSLTNDHLGWFGLGSRSFRN